MQKDRRKLIFKILKYRCNLFKFKIADNLIKTLTYQIVSSCENMAELKKLDADALIAIITG